MAVTTSPSATSSLRNNPTGSPSVPAVLKPAIRDSRQTQANNPESYWKTLRTAITAEDHSTSENDTNHEDDDDDVWIVADNAKSHETRRLVSHSSHNLCLFSSLEQHFDSIQTADSDTTATTAPLTPFTPDQWDRHQHSVVGFVNSKTNRWGTSQLSPPPNGKSPPPATTAGTGIQESGGGRATSAAAAAHTSTMASALLNVASKLPLTNDSSQSTLSLWNKSDSTLNVPARRDSVDAASFTSIAATAAASEAALIMPQRRVSDTSSSVQSSPQTQRSSLGSSTSSSGAAGMTMPQRKISDASSATVSIPSSPQTQRSSLGSIATSSSTGMMMMNMPQRKISDASSATVSIQSSPQTQRSSLGSIASSSSSDGIGIRAIPEEENDDEEQALGGKDAGDPQDVPPRPRSRREYRTSLSPHNATRECKDTGIHMPMRRVSNASSSVASTSRTSNASSIQDDQEEIMPPEDSMSIMDQDFSPLSPLGTDTIVVRPFRRISSLSVPGESSEMEQVLSDHQVDDMDENDDNDTPSLPNNVRQRRHPSVASSDSSGSGGMVSRRPSAGMPSRSSGRRSMSMASIPEDWPPHSPGPDVDDIIVPPSLQNHLKIIAALQPSDGIGIIDYKDEDEDDDDEDMPKHSNSSLKKRHMNSLYLHHPDIPKGSNSSTPSSATWASSVMPRNSTEESVSLNLDDIADCDEDDNDCGEKPSNTLTPMSPPGRPARQQDVLTSSFSSGDSPIKVPLRRGSVVAEASQQERESITVLEAVQRAGSLTGENSLHLSGVFAKNLSRNLSSSGSDGTAEDEEEQPDEKAHFQAMLSSVVLTRARRQHEEQQHSSPRKAGLQKSKWNGIYGQKTVSNAPETKAQAVAEAPIRRPPTRTDSRELALGRRYERRHAILAEATFVARSRLQEQEELNMPALIEIGSHAHQTADYLKALEHIHATTIRVERQDSMPDLMDHNDDDDEDDDVLSHATSERSVGEEEEQAQQLLPKS